MIHCNSVARKKLNAPPDWEAFFWERIGPDGLKVKGGIPRLLTRGKRKGRKTWDGEVQTCIVTDAEIEAERESYEAFTGNCGNCIGEGIEFASWPAADGVKTKTCCRCKGSGYRAAKSTGEQQP